MPAAGPRRRGRLTDRHLVSDTEPIFTIIPMGEDTGLCTSNEGSFLVLYLNFFLLNLLERWILFYLYSYYSVDFMKIMCFFSSFFCNTNFIRSICLNDLNQGYAHSFRCQEPTWVWEWEWQMVNI